jgi:hypothetical protein
MRRPAATRARQRVEAVNPSPLDALCRLLDDLDRERTSVVELLCRTARPQPWTLYPGEYGIFDRKTSSQLYFHAHDGREEEIGHFHTVRLFPDRTVHLVAISIGNDRRPRALSTLNLWAIGDTAASAGELKRYVTRFSLDERHGEPRVVRFVNLVFRAFEPEILHLQDAKIAALYAYRRAHPGIDPFEDRQHEVLSSVDVSALTRLWRTDNGPREQHDPRQRRGAALAGAQYGRPRSDQDSRRFP